MQIETIHQKMHSEPSSLPVPFLNGIVRRIRVAAHNLVLFYVNRLAKNQAGVNHTVGDWILHLNALNRHRQEEVERLMAQLTAVQAQLDAQNNENKP